MPHISASGCVGSKGSLSSRPTDHPRRPLLRSSRWHAYGNVYLVHEGPVTGVDLSGTDGAVEVLAVEGDDISVGIVNPDGSRAEMSGNGTRIAAAWLMSRTGSSRARVRVGPSSVEVRRTGDALYESEFSAVQGGGAGARQRNRADPGRGRKSPRRSPGRPEPDRGARATAREASSLPGADERAGRPRERTWRSDRPRPGARRGGDESVGDERGGSRGSDPPRRRSRRPLSRRRPAGAPGRRPRVAHRAGGAARRIAGLRSRNRYERVTGSAVSSPPRAEGATPPYGRGCDIFSAAT